MEPNSAKHNFYIVYRDGVIMGDLTFDESYDLFTKVLGSDNPCSVYRTHDEMRVVDS